MGLSIINRGVKLSPYLTLRLSNAVNRVQCTLIYLFLSKCKSREPEDLGTECRTVRLRESPVLCTVLILVGQKTEVAQDSLVETFTLNPVERKL